MMPQWVRLPSAWIEQRGLTHLRWQHGGGGSDNIAALMALAPIAHAADGAGVAAGCTYDSLCAATGLSRAKMASGLAVLKGLRVIEEHAQRSAFRLCGYDPSAGWAKLPGRSLYSGNAIAAFEDFRLRRIVELDALKLYYLFVSRRNRNSNLAQIGYDKIEEYTGVSRGRIKTAISFLASLSLVYVEQLRSTLQPDGISNAYRIVGVDPYNHLGTAGRARP